MHKIFLDTLFGNVEQGYFHLWHKETKRSYWFNDVADAIEFVSPDMINLYVGIGLMPSSQGLHKRMSAAEVSGIVGFYLDVDIAGRGHGKEGLPENENQAIEVIEYFPLSPSLIVRSGGGLQAWWAFKEPWMFDTDDERKQAATLSFRFNYTFKQKYTLDSIYNLDRLARVPNTINRKPGRDDVRATLMVVNEGCLYNPDDIEQYCLLESEIQRESPKVSTSLAEGKKIVTENGLILDPEAKPSSFVIKTLCEHSPLFEQAWTGQRKDLKSASDYDMSIASIAAHLGLDDQDIVDLIIAWRRNHAGENISLHPVDPKKALNPGYIGLTLANVRKTVQAEAILEQNEAVEAVTGTPYDTVTPDKRRKAAQDVLAVYFPFKVLRLLVTHSDEVTYEMETDKYGLVPLGSADAIVTPKTFLMRLIDAGITQKPKIPKGKWDQIASALLTLREDVSVEEAATEAGEFKELLVEYLRNLHPISAEEVTPDCEPFFEVCPGEPERHQSWLIRQIDLARFIRSTHGIRYKPREVARLLNKIGSKREKINFLFGDTWTSRSYYRITKDMVGDVIPHQFKLVVVEGGK